MVERFGIAHRKADIGFYLGLITTSFLACQSLRIHFGAGQVTESGGNQSS